jgi:hypothetical protein
MELDFHSPTRVQDVILIKHNQYTYAILSTEDTNSDSQVPTLYLTGKAVP